MSDQATHFRLAVDRGYRDNSIPWSIGDVMCNAIRDRDNELTELRKQLEQNIIDIASANSTAIEKHDQLVELQRRFDEFKLAYQREHEEIYQTLGKALGYPWLKDDQENFPGATEADGVVCGDHVAASLASEAAGRIAELNGRISEQLAYMDEYSERCMNVDDGKPSELVKDLVEARKQVAELEKQKAFVVGVNHDIAKENRDLKAKLAQADEDRETLATTSGVLRIAKERHRQVSEEGWSHEHDDLHTNGELADAAARYASPGFMPARSWPWDNKWWKPSPNDRIKDLIKAGALIAAEIDRIERLSALQQEKGEGDSS